MLSTNAPKKDKHRVSIFWYTRELFNNFVGKCQASGAGHSNKV